MYLYPYNIDINLKFVLIAPIRLSRTVTSSYIIQGAKEYTPALTMKVIEEGRYSVDFHAKLSSLQAFSICVAMLHCTEASSAVRWERDKQSLQCNPLRVFIEEEVKNIIEAVAKEEERKVVKKREEIPPSFKPNPPFSPIARV